MKIALLGSGDVFYCLAEKIEKSHHNLIALATNFNNVIEKEILSKYKITAKIYKDYKDMIEKNIEVDLFVMCSYAPLIKKEAFEKYHFINIHYTLLPRYRGVHGMVWSMINDEKQMGYTVFQINDVIDGGLIYEQYRMEINDDMDCTNVRNILEEHLQNHLVEYLDNIEKGKKPKAQNEEDAIFVTKRTPEEGLIQWNWSSRLIFNHIRALTPPMTPGAFTYYKGKRIVLLKARYKEGVSYYSSIGKIVNKTSENSIYVKCGDGIIEITEIMVDGEKISPGLYFKKVGIQLSESGGRCSYD